MYLYGTELTIKESASYEQPSSFKNEISSGKKGS